MSAWTRDELERIGRTDELEVASLRRDGTLRDPVTVWVVRHGDELYVRSVNGRTAAWFRGTHVRHEGRIEAGGVARDVSFEDADDAIADELDAAYRAKYRRYARSIVDRVVSPGARSAALKLVPRDRRS